MQAKNYSITVTFRAGGLPSGEDSGFPAIGIPDTEIHPGAAELRAACRPSIPLLAGELGLHPTAGVFLGPGASRLAPVSGLSTALLILQQGKAGDLGGETAF